MKKYIKPTTKVSEFRADTVLLADSGKTIKMSGRSNKFNTGSDGESLDEIDW